MMVADVALLPCYPVTQSGDHMLAMSCNYSCCRRYERRSSWF